MFSKKKRMYRAIHLYHPHIIGKDGDKILASDVRPPRQTSVIAVSETCEPGIELAITI